MINSASANATLTQLTLVGQNFGTVKKLNLFMAGVASPLAIVSVTDTVQRPVRQDPPALRARRDNPPAPSTTRTRRRSSSRRARRRAS